MIFTDPLDYLLVPEREDMSDLFQKVCIAKGLGEPVTEYRFAPPRKFRFDYAWPDKKIAVEVEGGVFTKGAHGSISGILRDIQK